MKRFRKIAVVTLVWLTAATTVAAGMPYSICHCALSSLNSAVARPANNQTCCGCSGKCCRTDSVAPSRAKKAVAKSSCCSGPKPRTQGPLSPQPRISCAGCIRTLAQAQPVTVSSDKRQLEEKATAHPLLTLYLPRVSLAQSLDSRQAWRDSPGDSPPTDLITTLQRLLI
jgi:hypothetical protein